MSRFEAQSYSRYRIHYPKKLFEPLKPYCNVTRKGVPLSVLDLGAGTGFAAASFLNFWEHETHLTLVEPDLAMLEESQKTLKSHEGTLTLKQESAESFQIDHPVDLILVGSAWHWMNSKKVMDSLHRALKPGGVIFIFEYQFPKAKSPNGAELNEWVRREFNLRWKPETQKPRGTLLELTEPIRAHSDWVERARVEFSDEQRLNADEFFGVIVSQSRYLEYEKTISPEQKNQRREKLRGEIKKTFGLNLDFVFSYPFQGFLFQRRII